MAAVQMATSEETQHILATVRRLTDQVLHPAERLLDALPDPDDLPGHASYRAALERARALGIHRATVPEDHGGLGAGWDVGLLAVQEIAVGAPGFAAQLWSENAVASVVTEQIRQAEMEAIARLWSADDATPALAFAVVQPGGGAHGPVTLPDSGLGFRSALHRSSATSIGTVTHDGNGQIRAVNVRIPHVAAADRASHLVLMVASGDEASSVHLLDLAATRGLRRQPLTHRMGLRVHGHADVLLDDVTSEQTLLGPAQAARLLEAMLTANSLGMAAVAVGLARNAHRYALDYCKTRVQGGKPIIEHQSVARSLWRASSSIDVVRHALAAAVTGGDARPDLRAALALRTVAAEMVSGVTIDMLELLGGYGVTTDYHTEKLYRDARVLISPSGLVEGAGVDAAVSLL